MIITQGANEYHHLKVTEIKDYTDGEHPLVILKGEGRVMMRDSRARNGYKVNAYYTRVYIKGMLMYYVLSEIDEGDLVFVVGRSNMCKPNKYNNVRMVDAEAIYKEDWIKYYNNYGNVNPKDLEDMI